MKYNIMFIFKTTIFQITLQILTKQQIAYKKFFGTYDR